MTPSPTAIADKYPSDKDERRARSDSVSSDRQTGFDEPLSTERNTTLPHPQGLTAPSMESQEDLTAKAQARRHELQKSLSEVTEENLPHNHKSKVNEWFKEI